jgi:hypothetical protein
MKDEDVSRGGYASANCIFYELQEIRRLMTEDLLDHVQGDSTIALIFTLVSSGIFARLPDIVHPAA